MLFLLLALLPSALPVRGVPGPAGGGGYAFDIWQVEQGLPGNTITALAQTPDGYLWVGTFGGLVRFDGVRFTVFDERTPGLTEGAVRDLFVDDAGGLWVFQAGGGVARLAAGKFQSFDHRHGWPEGATAWTGTPTREAPGRWLVLNQRGELYRFNGERFAPVPVEGPVGRFTGLAADVRPGAPPWLLHERHPGVLGPGGWRAVPGDGEPMGPVSGTGPARDGGLWVFAGGKLRRLREDAGVAEEIPYPADTSVPGAILEDAAGRLWISTWGKGLICVERDGSHQRFALAEGFPSDVVRRVFQDREGNVWAATNGGGLVRVKRRAFTSFERRRDFPPPHPLPLTVNEDAAGGLWIGCLDTGLYQVAGSRLEGPVTVAGRVVTAPGVWSLAARQGGGMWVGSRGGGLAAAGAGTEHWWRQRDGLPDDHVIALCEARDGTLWIGTQDGLARFAGGVFTRYGTEDGLLANHIRALAEDAAEALWIGTINGGLNRLTAEGISAVTNGLPSRTVDALLAEADGSVWIGTPRGLCLWRAGRLFHFTPGEGLGALAINAILDDQLGHLWLGSNRGVWRVARAELEACVRGEKARPDTTNFGRSEGLVSIQISSGHPAGVRTRDGRLWFATAGGVSVVNPREVPHNPHPPPVIIEALRVDDEAWPLPAEAGPPPWAERRLPDGPPPRWFGQARLPPGVRRMEIQYTGLSLTAPDRVRFQHRLDGFDSGWRDAGGQRTVAYQGLAPGEYVFRVRAANNDGVWNEAGAAVALVLAPAFWQTWWFRGGGLLAGAGLLGAAYRRRLARLEAARAAQQEFSRRLLESQEQERQRLAADLHDSLGQSLLVIKNRAVMGLGLAADAEQVRGQLRHVSDMASEAIREVRSLAQALRPQQLDEVGLTRSLEAMIRRLGESSPVAFHADITGLDGALPREQEIHFYRVIQECLTNIVRHAQATRAEVTIHRHGPVLRARVRDDGRGLSAAARDGTAGGPGGLGLRSIRERLRALGGRVEFQSPPGGGTCIVIEVPARPDAPTP